MYEELGEKKQLSTSKVQIPGSLVRKPENVFQQKPYLGGSFVLEREEKIKKNRNPSNGIYQMKNTIRECNFGNVECKPCRSFPVRQEKSFLPQTDKMINRKAKLAGTENERQVMNELGNKSGVIQCKISLPYPSNKFLSLLPAYINKNRIIELMNAVQSAVENRVFHYEVENELNTSLNYISELTKLQESFELFNDVNPPVKNLAELNDAERKARALLRIQKSLEIVTGIEEGVMKKIAGQQELSAGQRSCFIEPVLNDSLYGGNQAAAAVTDIRKIIDADTDLSTIPVNNPAHAHHPQMPTEIPRIITYAQAKALLQAIHGGEKEEFLNKMLLLAEDVTHWIRGGGRRIDSRTADRKNSQNEGYAGSLRSIHQNVQHGLPDHGEPENPRWNELSSEIQLNDAVQQGGNSRRFLEYTLWGHDRMVYDTVSFIAYFTEHYQFYDNDYHTGGQVEDDTHTKNPFFGINMNTY